jgi:hypothetical protein
MGALARSGAIRTNAPRSISAHPLDELKGECDAEGLYALAGRCGDERYNHVRETRALPIATKIVDLTPLPPRHRSAALYPATNGRRAVPGDRSSTGSAGDDDVHLPVIGAVATRQTRPTLA